MKNTGKHIGRLMRRLPAGLLTAGALVLMLWLTLAPQPLPEEDIPSFPGADKVAHALMFGGIFFLMMFDWETLRLRNVKGGAGIKKTVTASMTVTCMVVCALLGGGIELLQGTMEMGRGCDPLDFLADCAGVVIAAAVIVPLLRWLR